MERITITVEDDLLSEIDALCQKRGYKSRSEIFRDMAREALAREAVGPAEQLDSDQPCYGSLTYVYDHGIRDLPNRLTADSDVHPAGFPIVIRPAFRREAGQHSDHYPATARGLTALRVSN